MATSHFYILPKPLRFHQGIGEQYWATGRQKSFRRSKVDEEPETRLWKVCVEAVCPRLNVFEWMAFLLFGAVSLGALVYGFCELHHLLSSGALDQTVRAFLSKS
jgi:hypothetical protein